MNYREVVFTVQVKSRCWKCPLTSTLVTHSSPSRCQIVCVRARPPQKRAFHRISRHLSWAALHLPICIDQTAFISPLHGGKKITIKKAKKEYQKKVEHPVSESLPQNNAVWGCLQETLCHVLRGKKTAAVDISQRASLPPASPLSHCERRTCRPVDAVAGSSLTQYIFTWTPSQQLPIAAGKVSSVYETINYTYLIL